MEQPLNYYQQNPQKWREYHRAYRAANKERLNAYQRQYQRTRRETDPEFKAKALENTKRYYKEKGGREKARARAKEKYQNDCEHRRAKLDKAKEKYHGDPDHRRRMNEYSKEYARRKRAEKANK
jgi:hypothetical protein